MTDIMKDGNHILAFLFGLVLLFFMGALSFTILYRMWSSKIDLSMLISEKDSGLASMSRLQLLIFTFVISMSLFVIVVGADKPAFPTNFPAEILTLLGISGSSYLVSKAIQSSSQTGAAKPTVMLSPATFGPMTAGAPVALTASLMNVPPGTTMPALTWSLDAPAYGKIDPAPPDKATYTAPSPSERPGTVTVRAKATGFEDGIATITLA